MTNYPLLKNTSMMLLFPALAPALGGAVSIRAGVVLGALILAVVLVTGPVNMLLARRVPRGVRLVCTAIIAITLATVCRFYLSVNDQALLDSLWIFLPLVAINIIVIRQVALYDGSGRRRDYLASLWLGVVFAALLVAVGGVREVLLTGSLGSTAILAIDLSFFGAPGGLLIVMGALLALGQALARNPRRRGVENG